MAFLVVEPGGEALAEAFAEVGLLRGEVSLLVGIAGEVVELFAAEGGVVDVFVVAFAEADEEVVHGAVEIGARGTRGAEEAVALPGGWRGNVEEVENGGAEVDLGADGVGAAGGFEEEGIPDDEGDVDVFLVDFAGVSPGAVGEAEGFAVVADDEEDGVVGEVSLAEGIHQSAELAIGFVECVEEAAELPAAGFSARECLGGLFVEVDFGLAGGEEVGVMGTLCPGEDVEGFGGVLVDPLEDHIDGVAVFDAPGEIAWAAGVAAVPDGVEAAVFEEIELVGVLVIAAGDEGGAVAEGFEGLCDGVAWEVGAFDGVFPPGHGGVDGEEHGCDGVGGVGEVGVDVVEDEGVGGFGVDVWGGFEGAAVEAHVLGGDGFEDDDDDVSGAAGEVGCGGCAGGSL